MAVRQPRQGNIYQNFLIYVAIYRVVIKMASHSFLYTAMNTSIPTGNPLIRLTKAVGDPLRLEVLRLLHQDSYGVLELCRITDTPQSGMSHHLRILNGANLVERRKEGTSIFYRRTTKTPHALLESLTQTLFQTIDQMPLSLESQTRKEAVHGERSRRSAAFFEEHHEQLKDNQELIAEFAQYRDCLSDLLQSVDRHPHATALEIGAGSSPLMQLLSQQYGNVTCIDNSEAMLSATRAAIQAWGLKNVDCRYADFLTIKPHAQMDLLVINMVLHHIASPSSFFEAARAWMVPEGRLLVIDLCPHDQDWAREICGDQWLGFDPSDLLTWALDAGFRSDQTAYLGLKNGFQIQIHLFQPNIEL